jgi:hypothetical protein
MNPRSRVPHPGVELVIKLLLARLSGWREVIMPRRSWLSITASRGRPGQSCKGSPRPPDDRWVDRPASPGRLRLPSQPETRAQPADDGTHAPNIPPCEWCSSLAVPLPGSPPLFLDTVLARGRRAITRSILTAGLNGQSQYCYTALAAAVKKAEAIDANLVL